MKLPYGWMTRKNPRDPRTVVSRKWGRGQLYAVIEKPRGCDTWYVDIRVQSRPYDVIHTKDEAIAKAIALIEEISR